ncbi:MAG: hypothetical protein K8I02_05735, partial [Candidatus Methylomirabilis sp.]|nr:hypothetical protein [Deltaproteobacteria bacterium]
MTASGAAPAHGVRGTMEDRLLDFIGALRRADIRVSTSEDLDAFAALEHLGLADRYVFRSTLRSTLIKRQKDLPLFDTLFDLYWGSGPRAASVTQDNALAKLTELLDQLSPEVRKILEALLEANAAKLQVEIERAAHEVNLENISNMLQVNFFARRLMEKMKLPQAQGEMENLFRQVEAGG